MQKLIIAATAFVIIGIPAAFAASPSAQKTSVQAQGAENDAAKKCKAERQRVGHQAFEDAHGTNKNKRNAFGKCVSSKSKDKDDAEDDNGEKDDAAATKACRSERASMPADAFAKRYGTNHNLKNAFGKCVSGKAKAASDAQTKTTVNAAKECKAERKSLGTTAFNNKYGTNKNKKNAFGKCVSAKAKAKPCAVPAS